MRRRYPDTAAVERAIRANVAHWSSLADDERADLLADTEWLLGHKHWEAAGGITLDDTVRSVIAAQAALLVLRLGTDHLRQVTSVIVYPTAVVAVGERPGPVPGTRTDAGLPLHGLATGGRGPVLIAWDQAIAASRHPGSTHNVVLHEFAHKLDQLDGMMDGTPPLDRTRRPRWIELCQRIFDDMRLGNPHPPLRPYGATNPSEFFAVATEAFFDWPAALERGEPELYDALRDYYRQDPARRAAPALP